MPIIRPIEATMPWESIVTTPAIDWRFLTPSRDVLRPLLQYEDSDELDAGTLQDRLDYLIVHLEDLDYLVQRHAHTPDDQDPNETRSKFLIRIREALELIGLALHYDPMAWSDFLHPVTWDTTSISNPFEYDASQLQPLFQLLLQDDDDVNSSDDFDLLCELFVEFDTETMSDAYVEAKAQLKRVVTATSLSYDDDYRIPLKLFLAPEWDGVGTEPEWCEQLRNVIWSLTNRNSAGGSAFQLVSMELPCWHCETGAWINQLMREIRLANVALSDLALPSPPIAAATFNTVTGAGSQFEDGPFVDNLVVIRYPQAMRDTDMLHWIALCSAVVHTQTLKSLHLFGGLPLDEAQRAVCWRWLGFALQGQFAQSSLRELLLQNNYLELEDVDMFVGTNVSAFRASTKTVEGEAYSDPYPEHFGEDGIVRSVQLAADTVLSRFGFEGPTVSDLHLSNHNFMVVNEAIDGCEEPSMMVLVPGFGLCPVACESVVNASVFPVGDISATNIERLRLHIEESDSMAMSGLASRFGASLLRLEIVMSQLGSLSHVEMSALLTSCSKLQYLELKDLGLESMDSFTTAYQKHHCQLSVLTMWNVYVDAASMTRFAQEMSNPSSRMSSQLREFRFMCEDIDGTRGDTLEIITNDGAEFFYNATRLSSALSFFEIGLVRSVYDQWKPKFSLQDRERVVKRWKATKLAFLSVAVLCESAAKKPKTRIGIRLPVKYRRRLVTRIFEFIRPPTNRIVNVLGVPRLNF